MSREEAVADVAAGRAERICVPGEWVVWREEDKVLSKDLGQ